MTLGMTVRELLVRIDSRELAEWAAYYNVSPFGPDRSDLRAGVIAATVANCHSVKGKFKPSDFVPKVRRPAVEQTPQDLKAVAVRITAMLGGTFVRS